ncbi:hypothetical protein ONZ51_g7039 [Trametes cubensis]|uniref:Uncharacterized protein n=1 Tax=Trametes cubensis TaxID=1111947 RepID=A0AAD7X9I9_9APHY|nr:hypothetical protein ONZ51_g7039 [Trametes cubensis]
MKAKVNRKMSKATRRPYDSSTRGRATPPSPKRAKAETSQAASASAYVTPSPYMPMSIPTSATGAVLYRDFCMQRVKARYPTIKPCNDWELLYLTETKIEGTVEEVYAELDEEYIGDIREYGFEACERMVADHLASYIEPTGMKPLPKEVNKYVYIRSIPDTKYSIRLFPGSISAAEYCLDFVDSATGEPVNSPFEFELWAVENPETPWLSMPVTMQMRSIEYAHGIKQADILPGHEKFILRDGLTCVLIRPGKPKIQFTVPVRKLPDQAKAAPEDVVILDLPKMID